jgi:hypothetical protein
MKESSGRICGFRKSKEDGAKQMKRTTIQFTPEQQKQIKDAIGKSITELTIEAVADGSLSNQELEKIAGGGLRKSSSNSATGTIFLRF